MEVEYITFDTRMGWVGIMGSAKGLLGITLPQRSAREAFQLLGDSANYAKKSSHLFADLIERLRSYFGGQMVTFSDQIDFSGATSFQRDVWEATKLIPYGETRSYRWVAEQIGKPRAMRAVGQALGKNPLPIIVPCHRVLASDGRLAGFREGVEVKNHLLSLEAAANSQ